MIYELLIYILTLFKKLTALRRYIFRLRPHPFWRSRKYILLTILGIAATTSRVVSRGKRLIILHTMGENGWVDGALWTNATSGLVADYHQEMNATTFEDYLVQLCPKLGEGAVLIMDNAPYHSRKLSHPPTKSSRYGDMTVWCDENDIEYDHERATTDRHVKNRFTKDAFFHQYVAPNIRPQHTMYAAEAIAAEYDVEILRLPPYHCFFNPIEMAWSVIKRYVGARNTIDKIPTKLDAIKALLQVTERNLLYIVFLFLFLY